MSKWRARRAVPSRRSSFRPTRPRRLAPQSRALPRELDMTARNDTWIALHRLMLVTRELDRVIGAADGHWHPALGEEGVVAGCYHGLRSGDALVPHYRGMLAACYARGGDLARLLAGLEGKATSYSRGRYRSDVCGPIELGVIGLYSGALGPTLEYAAGAG